MRPSLQRTAATTLPLGTGTPEAPAAPLVPAPFADLPVVDYGVWQPPYEQLVREAQALAGVKPERCAWMLVAAARVAFDLAGDAQQAQALLGLASTQASGSRVVATARRWLSLCEGRTRELADQVKVELGCATHPAERVELLGMLAAIEDQVSGRSDVAESWLKEAATLDASDLTTSLALASLYSRHGRHSEAAAEWERIAAQTSDGAVKAAWLTSSGLVREAQLGDVIGARAALERAVQADPSDLFARASLEPILQRAEAWREYAGVLSDEAAQLTEDPATSRLLYERAGDALWEAVSDGPAAVSCYERAAGVAPQEPGPLRKMIAVLEAQSDASSLEPVYSRLLRLAQDPSERAAVLFRLGVLYDQRQDAERALSAWQSAYEAMPTFAAAIDALDDLCTRLGRFDVLTALLRVDAERIVSPAHRAARYVRLAELYAGKLGDLQEAAAMCERALSLDRTQAAAFDLLDEILRASGDLDAVVSLYESSVEAEPDPRMARVLRLELAMLHLAGNRPERAIEPLRDALGAEPDALATLWWLGKAQARSERWTELVETLEAQARLLSEPASQVTAWYRIAFVLEARVGDPLRAVAAYERVLSRAPDHQAAIEGLLRLRGGQSRWEDVVGLERRLAALAARPDDAAARLYRAGWVLEQQIGRADEAVRAYEAALANSPRHVPSALALSRVLRHRGDGARLAASHEARAANASDPETRADALAAAAAVYELRLGDHARALASYDKALSARPGHEAALWGKVRLDELTGDWKACSADIRALLSSKSHAATRAALLMRAARVHEFRLDDRARASALSDEAMACGTARPVLIVDRLRASLGLPLGPEAAAWLAQAASSTVDRRWAGAVARTRMFLAALHDASPEELEDASTKVLAFRSGDVQALELLASVLTRRKELVGLVPVIVRAARQVEHGPQRAMQLSVAAQLAERNGDRSGAADIATEALRGMDDCFPALQTMRRLSASTAAWTALVSACEQIAACAADRSNACAALLEAGDAQISHLKTPEPALRSWRGVLEREPSNQDAFERAASVLDKQQAWAPLEELIAGHIAAVKDPSRVVELHARRARVLAERLGKVREAIAATERAIEGLSGSVELAQLLAQLYEHDGQWQKAVQAWQRVAGMQAHAVVRDAALLRQATILSTTLGEWSKAREILEKLAGQTEEPAVAREAGMRLADACMRLGDVARARDLYRGLGDTGTAKERVEAIMAAAELSDTQLADRDGTTAALEQALTLATEDPLVLGVVEAWFQRREAWQRYVALADRIAERAGKGAAGTLALRMSVARTYRTRLRSSELADMHLRATSELFPRSIEPRLALGVGQIGRNDRGALEELRAAVQIDPFCAEAHRGIASIAQRLGVPGCAGYSASAAALLGDTSVDAPPAAVTEPIPEGLLPDDALTLVVGPTRVRTLRRAAALVDGCMHQILPVGPDALGQLGRLQDGLPVVMAVRAIGQALGVKSVNVMRGAARALSVYATEPRTLAMGGELLSGAGVASGLFETARALAHLAAGSSMLLMLPSGQPLGLMLAATEPEEGDCDRDLRKRVLGALPRKVRKELERIRDEEDLQVRRDLAGWEAEERTRALRVAVAVARDMRMVAWSLAPQAMMAGNMEERRARLAADERVADALRFAGSEGCWGAWQRLYGGR